MNYLADDHIEILKRLTEGQLKKSELKDEEYESIYYLESEGLVRRTNQYDDEENNFLHESLFNITQFGRAIYETSRRERRRWLIPVTISVIALLVSIISSLWQISCNSSVPIVYKNKEQNITNVSNDADNIKTPKNIVDGK